MVPPMPPQASQGPQPSPQSQPPQAGGQPPQGAGQSPAGQAVAMIAHGFQTLGQMLKQAGGSIPPEDHQLFDQAQKTTEAFIQSLMGNGQKPQGPTQSAQPQAGAKPPMPANANANSRPANF